MVETDVEPMILPLIKQVSPKIFQQIKQVALSLAVRKAADKDRIREYKPALFRLQDGLNEFFKCERGSKKSDTYAAVEIPVYGSQSCVVMDLDESNDPISRAKVDLGVQGCRKVAILVLTRKDYLSDYNGKRDAEILPGLRKQKELLERFGYDVVTVHDRVSIRFLDDDRFLRKLSLMIRGKN